MPLLYLEGAALYLINVGKRGFTSVNTLLRTRYANSNVCTSVLFCALLELGVKSVDSFVTLGTPGADSLRTWLLGQFSHRLILMQPTQQSYTSKTRPESSFDS